MINPSYSLPDSWQLVASSIKAYRVLAAAMLLVCLASTVWLSVVLKGNDLSAHRYMNTFMGCFFLIFAIPKFVNLSAFAQSFKRYDFIAKRFPVYARLYPLIELGLAAALLNPQQPSMTTTVLLNTIIIFISFFGLIGILAALRRKENLFCACLGTSFRFPLSKVSLVENGFMLAMALLMIVLDNQPMAAMSHVAASIIL